MKIKEMPWFNRPGARLKRKGVSSLSDAELLSIVLGRGSKKENVIDLSNRVLGDYNFNKLSDLSFTELQKEFDDKVKAMKIQAMFEIFRRTNRLEKRGFKTQIKTAEDVYNHFVDELKYKKKEHFYALFLDTDNCIIEESLISIGILDASLVHPREVFNPAIKANSQSVILTHNHPCGDCEPSPEDKEVTKILVKAGKILGINVLDHVIIGENGFISFQEKGLI